MLTRGEKITRALKIYDIIKESGSLPKASHSVEYRILRTFLNNYRACVGGKRSGEDEYVTLIFDKCIKNFYSSLSLTKTPSTKFIKSVNKWCLCYKRLGVWPSVKCYKENPKKWVKLLGDDPTKLITGFRNFRQLTVTSLANNRPVCYPKAVEYIKSFDPYVFDRKYKKNPNDVSGDLTNTLLKKCVDLPVLDSRYVWKYA